MVIMMVINLYWRTPQRVGLFRSCSQYLYFGTTVGIHAALVHLPHTLSFLCINPYPRNTLRLPYCDQRTVLSFQRFLVDSECMRHSKHE